MAQEHEIIKLADLTPDANNYNRGTEKGAELIGKSFKKFGAGRSILLDKHGNIMAGDKSTKGAAKNGITDVTIVKTDGKQLVAVQRMDIDLNTKKGREMALADNATGAANLSWDLEAMAADGWTEKDLEGWGVDLAEVEPDGHRLIGVAKNKPATLKITFLSAADLELALPKIEKILSDFEKVDISISCGEV